MIIEELEIATQFKNENNSFTEFYNEFKRNYDLHKNVNIIVNYSEDTELETENILLFLNYAKAHRKNGMSFVLVAPNVDSDELPDNLMTAPTLQEALDIIELENIERDLGF
ncbi:ribonuclease Z [Flavobacteriaceae bacterium F08102]|nr:ribonuclease Z [Flavobacteriaceae bacterium F08102]